MADIEDLTFADNPYDEDGRGTTPSTQRIELSDEDVDRLLSSVRKRQVKGLPTQVVHPWRTVIRTLVQHVSGLIVAGLIWLLASIGVDVSELGPDLIISVSVLLTLAFSGAVARIMALPQVEDFLAKYISPIATGVADE